MSSLTLTLPNPDEWPLRVFLFVRWNCEAAPPPGTQASWKDLRYYLRAMRGPHWKMTVPLCVHEASEEDVQILENAIAYVETRWCERWFHPMEAWTAMRVLLIIVHAWVVGNPRLEEYEYGSFRDLIPHVTPHLRDPEPFDMSKTIAGLARLAKEFFPIDIFHYRRIYYGEHTKATGVVFNIPVWSDVGIQTTQSETEAAVQDTTEDAMEVVKDVLRDGYATDVHQAEDPREPHSISIPPANLPFLTDYGVLVQIPLP